MANFLPLKTMIVRCFVIAFLVSVLYSCENNGTSMSPELIRIYYQSDDIQNNATVFAMRQTDTGYAIFKVSTNTGSRFDGSGRLIVTFIDNEGIPVSEIYEDVGSGFPAGLIEDTSDYTIIWNYSQGVFKQITVSKTDGNITTDDLNISTELPYNPSYIAKIHKGENNNILLLGLSWEYISNEDITVRKSFIASMNAYGEVFSVGAYEYSPVEFGSLGNDELAILSKLDIYFLLSENVFAAPVNDKISFRYIGDPEAVFEDSEAWICAFSELENEKVSVVYNKSKIKDSYYAYDDLSLIKTNMSLTDFNAPKVLANIDTDEQIFILSVEKNNISNIVIGTSAAGQISINIFDSEGNATSKLMGNTYRYSVADVIWDTDKQMITIVGNTRMEYKYYRTFFVHIPLNELV